MPDDKHNANAVPELPMPIEELRDLIKRAQAGDQSVLPQLERILDEVPALWQHYGDLSSHCLTSWANLIAGSSLYLRETLLRKAAALKTEIGGSNPGPLEELLAERVMITWLVLVYYESLAAEVQVSLPLGELVQKRLDRAQRRHLAAIKALATFRKLMPKAVDTGRSTAKEAPTTVQEEEVQHNGAAVDPFRGVIDGLGPFDLPQRQSDRQPELVGPAMNGLMHRFAHLVSTVQSRQDRETELAGCGK